MQKTEQPEFVKTIDEIKGAEEEHDRIILEAKQKADKILREVKEKIVEENSKNSEKVVKFKNEKLREGSKEIEGEVQGLLKKAKEDGAKISKKKLASADVAKLVKDFLNSL